MKYNCTVVTQHIALFLLFKFSDNQTYVKVLTRLQILEPLEVCAEICVICSDLFDWWPNQYLRGENCAYFSIVST